MNVESLAIKCFHLEAMLAFYAEALGAEFQQVDVGVPDMRCFFGAGAGVTLKLVSGRESADFEGYPIHQLGFRVDDVERVALAAERHGGKREGPGCVRDPDGNTLELSQA